MLIDESLLQPHITENCPVDNYGLGRIHSFDPRDRKFSMVAPAAVCLSDCRLQGNNKETSGEVRTSSD